MKLDKQYAMVFEPKKSETRKKTVECRLSTYEGTDQNDNPRYSTWWCDFVGTAYKDALDLESKDRIRIMEGKVENIYDKESGKSYLRVKIFDFYKDDKQEEK